MRCARAGCTHFARRHQNKTGPCAAKPKGHCEAFLKATAPPSPTYGFGYVKGYAA